MEIYRIGERPTRNKSDGNEVIYGLFPECEININLIKPGVRQDWHYHKQKDEAILVIQGRLDVEQKVDEGIEKHRLEAGDIVRVEDTPHCFSNGTKEDCRFICFKTVPTGRNKRDILSGDKFSFDPNIST